MLFQMTHRLLQNRRLHFRKEFYVFNAYIYSMKYGTVFLWLWNFKDISYNNDLKPGYIPPEKYLHRLCGTNIFLKNTKIITWGVITKYFKDKDTETYGLGWDRQWIPNNKHNGKFSNLAAFDDIWPLKTPTFIL